MNELKLDHNYEKILKIIDGDIVLDIGASEGLFSIPLIGKASCLILVEPNPQYLDLLRNIDSIKKNESTKIIVFPVATWNNKEIKKLYIRGWGSSLIIDQSMCSHEGIINVETDTLDNIIELLEFRFGIKKIDFLKMDIEGAEIEALKGMEKSIDKGLIKKMVIAAYHYRHDGSQTCTWIDNWLQNKGFDVFVDYDKLVHAKLVKDMRDIGSLRSIATIERIFELIPGMITKDEAVFLYEMASKCSKAIIVEIGGYYGLSTTCLAKGSKSGGNMHVYSVDPCTGLGTTPDPTWMNSEDPGIPDPKYYKDIGTTFLEVRECFKKLQVDDIITSIVNYSEPAYKQGWNIPIELLFIDGDNRYNYVKMDLEMWGKHVIKGGIIIMHDQNHPGVRRVINDMIINNPRYEIRWKPLFHVIVK